jgi:hypothetical protein
MEKNWRTAARSAYDVPQIHVLEHGIECTSRGENIPNLKNTPTHIPDSQTERNWKDFVQNAYSIRDKED